MLASDARYLASGDKPFTDYSLLFEVYEPESRHTEPGSGCVPSRHCFLKDHVNSDISATREVQYLRTLGLTKEKCTIICVSTIDYFLRYSSTGQTIESAIVSGKWDDYDAKVLNMIQCVGDMAQLSSEQTELKQAIDYATRSNDKYSERFGYLQEPAGLNNDGHAFVPDDAPMTVIMTASLAPPTGVAGLHFTNGLEITKIGQGEIGSLPCNDYLQLLCSEIKLTNIEDIEGGSKCIYDVSGARALACKSFLGNHCSMRHGANWLTFQK